MPAMEELLREEFRRVTETVQPAQLRPLRVPGRRYGWRRRLLPVAAVAAVIAIAVVAALLVGTSASQRPATPTPPAPNAMPRYYVTVVHAIAGLEAVVRDSATGSVTGTVAVPDTSDFFGTSVTAAADDRHFVFAAVSNGSHAPGTAPLLFFRLLVSAHGRPEQPVELNFSNGGLVTGMALSPDGTMLALSMEYPSLGLGGPPYGSVETINLATGKTRTWTGGGARGYWPGAPWWGNGDRTLTFTWWHNTSVNSSGDVIVGVRQLDTSAPGDNLLASQLTGFPAAIRGIQSATVTSGGRRIVAAACHDTSPPGHPRGTVTARIIELSAADGQLLRVLRTQTARYTNLGEQDYLDGGCAVLSVDPSGNHVLVQDFGFGRIDDGAFTALPGASANVTFVVAGW